MIHEDGNVSTGAGMFSLHPLQAITKGWTVGVGPWNMGAV
jgi:hypothetical protein